VRFRSVSIYSVITLILAVSFGSPISANSWAQSIQLVEERAARIWERGRSLGADTHLGTAVNEIDIPKHRCAILGRMLGRADLIKKLEYHPEPSISSNPSWDELYNLMLYSHSLSNWVLVANAILNQSEDEKKHSWNLDCVGQMGIPSTAFEVLEVPKAALEVDGTDLRILGDIEAGFSAALVEALDGNPQVSRVVLGSRGGNVREALLAGIAIRKRGLDTTLSSNCYSACPLVFLGRLKRTIWSPYPNLGFHQMSDGSGNPIRSSSALYIAMEDYAEMMGADPNFVLASMLRANPSEMYEPEHGALCQYNVATWVQRLCFGGEKQ
jgi:hypothetical protein